MIDDGTLEQLAARRQVRYPSRIERRLHTFADAAGRARASGLRTCGVHVHRFPDGESLARSLPDRNDKPVETVLAADALRPRGARTVTLIAPYLRCVRQAALFRRGEPVSQRVIGDWLGRAFDDVLTVETHRHRVPRLSAVIASASRSLTAAIAAERDV